MGLGDYFQGTEHRKWSEGTLEGAWPVLAEWGQGQHLSDKPQPQHAPWRQVTESLLWCYSPKFQPKSRGLSQWPEFLKTLSVMKSKERTRNHSAMAQRGDGRGIDLSIRQHPRQDSGIKHREMLVESPRNSNWSLVFSKEQRTNVIFLVLASVHGCARC